jgi:hypothetical protein
MRTKVKGWRISSPVQIEQYGVALLLGERAADLAEYGCDGVSYVVNARNANQSDQCDKQGILNEILGFFANCQIFQYHKHFEI